MASLQVMVSGRVWLQTHPPQSAEKNPVVASLPHKRPGSFYKVFWLFGPDSEFSKILQT